MGDTLFNFRIGKYEIGMYQHFKTWYFYNGYEVHDEDEHEIYLVKYI